MNLKRKITAEFIAWKETLDHKPLVIKGCRQCGKTYSVLEFARSNYEHVVYINFFENDLYGFAFEGSLNIDDIIMRLSVALGPEAVFKPYATCIVLDEIQECPRARMALKFFKIDGRFDIMATGSLLGISGYKDQGISVPVGYETTLLMHPMDFEEFLWANGISESVISHLKECLIRLTPVHESIHMRMRELLLQYVAVGGMPEAVVEFLTNHTLPSVLNIQRDIVNGYREDMLKYAPQADKPRIRECFDSIPRQLSKENKKFQYSKVVRNGTASKFEGSLRWLADTGIIRICHNLTITELPLNGNAEESVFKVYMSDIGLLISMLEDGTQADIIRGQLFGYKGAVFENLVADFLSKEGRDLYYFRKDSGLEVDFVTRIGSECVLIECKAVSGNIKSAKTILNHPEKYHVRHTIKLGDYNIGSTETTLTLPLYLGFLIPALSEFPRPDYLIEPPVDLEHL